jgi:hypothetical protein
MTAPNRSVESRQSKLLFREKIMLDVIFIYVKKMPSTGHPFFTPHARDQSPT